MTATESGRQPSRGQLPPHVVDGFPMPIVLSRISDDSILHLNPEYSAAYGSSVREVVGRPFRDLHWVAEDRDLTLEQHLRGSMESVEVRIRSATGECCWAQADVSIFDYEGEVVYLTTLYDIGHKKSAERELEASMATIREMARFPEMNPGPVVRLDRRGTVLRANEAARRAFGEMDLEGKCLWDLVPDLDDRVVARVGAGSQPVRADVRIGASWYALTLALERDSDHIFLFGTDVSAQAAAERELAERARFPEMNPGPVARLRSDGTVHRANRAASRVFGQADIRNESFRDLCRIPEDLWARILGSGEPVNHEVAIDGLWLSFTLVYEPNSDQVFAYGSDITELKAAEQALADLARFPDMNPGPVLRLNRQGDVVLANRAARDLFETDDLTGRSWLDLCPGVDDAFWSQVCDSAQPVAFEAKLGHRYFVLHHARGPQGVYIFVYGSDLTAQKNAESALRHSEKMATLGTLTAGMAHELNNPAAAAQRAAEQLEIAFTALQDLQLAIRALRLDEAAGQLLDQLNKQAHASALRPATLTAMERGDRENDIEDWLADRGVAEPWEYTPSLVEIGHTADGLSELEGRGGGDHVGLIVAWQAQAHRVYRLTEEIRNSSSRLVEIVTAMKAYAYLGQAPLLQVDVNEGLRNTLLILHNKLKDEVEVTLELDPKLPTIEAFGSDLNQVWTNLIDNAIDAMDGHGRIRIRTRRRTEGVTIEIEDDGPGIPESIQPRIFDAFFTTKAPGKGTGLGLNTAYNAVVKKHGGAIRLDSIPGRTCFTIDLPARATPSPEEAAEAGG